MRVEDASVTRNVVYDVVLLFTEKDDLVFTRQSGRKRRIERVAASISTRPGESPLPKGDISYTALGYNILLSGNSGTAFNMTRYTVPKEINDLIQPILRKTFVKLFEKESKKK